MHESWKGVLKAEFTKDYFQALGKFVENERRNFTVHPPDGETFTAFKLTPFDKVRVVILGQDPYFRPGQAHGLAFSVKPGVTVPPSLVNIYKELETDVAGFRRPEHGNLTRWAEQGVFLLNATLTVRTGEAGSHQGRGWETFTSAVIKALVDSAPKAFVLWGTPARAKKALIPTDIHTIIESAHPSPLSAHHGFFGSRPFSKVNDALEMYGYPPIDWQL